MHTKKKLVSVFTIIALLFTIIPSVSIFAATGSTKLIVHYHRLDNKYTGNIETALLNGQVPGTVSEKTTDAYGLKMTFSFANTADDAYIGLTVKEDSVFPNDKKYVRAKNGVAEVWLKDGDARVYSEPQLINPDLIVNKNNKAYVAVEDLPNLLNLTYKYGKNGYKFDGAAKGTVDILTIYRDKDYFEINVDTNRIGANVTTSMLTYYTDVVFNDVDGFKQDNKYYLSLPYMERLFQIGALSYNNNNYLLKRQDVAYDQITTTAFPEQVGFDSEKLKKVDDYINNEINDGFPGAAVIITKDGKTVKNTAYGYLKKYNTPFVNGVYQPAQLLPQSQWERATVNSLWDLASNTKMYATNYAVQKLVSEGKLNLDQPISTFPGWENYRDSYVEYTGNWTLGGPGGLPKTPVTGKENVTVRDLLHHGAGNIPDPQYPNKTVAGDLWYQSSDITNRTGIIDKICKTPLQYKPRTNIIYSDLDFMILGLLVEQITGMPLDKYVENEIYGKLGISHTVFNPLTKGFSQSEIAATELNGNTRDGYINFGTMEDGSPVNIRKYTLQGQVHDEKAWYTMGGVSGHAGLFSTTGDMAVITQLMLNGGIYNGTQVFTKEVADQFTAPYSVSGTQSSLDSSTYGQGWRLASKSSSYFYFNWGPSRSTYGHQGWTGTLTIIDPVYNMTITILTNERHSPVDNPPNGFEGYENYTIPDFGPISARIYAALMTDKPPLNSVKLSLDNSNLERNQTANISLAGFGKGSTPVDLTNATVNYISTNPEVASVENGVVTAKNVGITDIYASVTLNGITVESSKAVVKVTTSVASIRRLIDGYQKSEELVGPLVPQLNNSLTQAEKFFNEKKQEQAVNHMEDFLKLLNNPPMSCRISEAAKEILNSDAMALIKQ
ncbi:penicillin binding protein PBP4B [Candidatus Clostridium radicumherbarum]|uniref:Penicillin binding protein PBP4B n=1 Tax=Candidatus Clostridium radicumherbarum TaxID=3381662 RepID=A0ABW8TS64_9CLOT